MPTDSSRLRDQLTALGLTDGATVMVHASLRRLGPIERRADGLLDCLQEVIGPRGTLLMPLGSDELGPFNCLSTPAERDIGVLAEVFRTREGTLVNDHVAGRFGANGARAAELVSRNPLNDYHGVGSVLDEFTRIGGIVLRLGADIDTVTVTHLAEYLADVPNKRTIRRMYIRDDTGPQWVTCLDDTNGIVDWPKGDYFSQILIDYLDQGRANRGTVGNCSAELFRADDFVEFAVSWMESNL